MKSIYKLFALVLCLSMLLSFSACKKKNQDPDPRPQEETQSQEETQTEDPNDTPTDPPVDEPDDTPTEEEIFQSAFEPKGTISELISNDLLDDDPNAEKSFRMELVSHGMMGLGNQSVVLARDGNKIYISYAGLECYLLRNEDLSAELYFGGVWTHFDDMHKALEAFNSAFAAIQNVINSMDNPLWGHPFSIEDFTYDESTDRYVAKKSIIQPSFMTENEMLVSNLSLKIEDGKILAMECNMTVQGIKLPLFYQFEYDEEGYLKSIDIDQTLRLDGINFRVLVETLYYHDQSGRFIKAEWVGKTGVAGFTTTVFMGKITVEYGFSIELPK